jgi:tripartite-type tricarboxylate transporter receptor subunit TctC
MQISRRSWFTAAASMLAAPALAQGWPVAGRPVTVIVPYAPSGSTDTSARLMAAAIERETGATVAVLNRPGAGSQIGVTEVARARPDGHTLLFGVLPTITTHYLDPARRAPYTRASFQPVGLHHLSPMTLAVRAGGPYRSVRDLVEAARARPEGVSISTSGLMATPHMEVLLLQAAAGVRFTSVHFTGGPQSATAVLGGHVDAVAGGASDVMVAWRNGDFRVLATAGEAPDPQLPGIPTFREQGYDVVLASAAGLIAPAGTPMPIVRLLTEAMRRGMQHPEYRQRIAQFGVTPHYLDPEAYAEYWARDEERMRPIMQSVSAG